MNDKFIAKLDSNSINILKGLAIIFIIFTHIENTNHLFLLGILKSFGYIGVNIFYTISGYLLVHNFLKKKYCKAFIKNKFFRLYIPYCFANLLFILYLYVNGEFIFNPICFIADTLGITSINGYSWYISNLLLIYIIYYVLYKLLVKGNKEVEEFFYWCLSLLSFLIFLSIKIICNIFQIPIILFNDFSFSLLLGMILLFLNLSCLRYIPKFVYLVLLMFCHSLYLIQYSGMLYILISLITSILCTFKCSFGKLNLLLTYLGKHTLSLYLLHIIPLKFFRSNVTYISNFYIYLIVYLVVLFIMSFLFEKIISKLKMMIIKD